MQVGRNYGDKKRKSARLEEIKYIFEQVLCVY